MSTQQFPEPTVGFFIFNPKDEILLVKTHKWKNKYGIPGGHIELHERIEQACHREAMEETGLKIYDLKFIRLDEYVFDKFFYKPKHFIFLDFSCKTKTTKVKLNDEAESYLWIKPEKAVKLKNIEPYGKKTIEIILRKSERTSPQPSPKRRGRNTLSL